MERKLNVQTMMVISASQSLIKNVLNYEKTPIIQMKLSHRFAYCRSPD
jgi:hypothetical protein